jgi:DNA primase
MRSISNTTGSISQGKALGQAGSFTDSVAGQDDVKDLISKANSIPMMRLFKHYGIRINEINRMVICPFKSHKGGRENSASFQFYPETNSFYCHGCKLGTKPVNFVSNIENISFIQSVHKIIEHFSDDIDEDNIFDIQDYSQRLEIMMEFSNCVREFRENYQGDKAFEHIEQICKHYDIINLKHNLDNDALRHVVDKLKEAILEYNE